MRLVNKIQIWNLKYWVLIINGLVVQLDRISDFGSEGWGFEPLRGHFTPCIILQGVFISTGYLPAGRQGISDFGSEGWGFPAYRQTGNPSAVTKKVQDFSWTFFLYLTSN